jgi:HEAT repeat protein
VKNRFFTWSLSVAGAALLCLAVSFWPVFRALTVADQLPRLKDLSHTSQGERRDAVRWLGIVGERDRLTVPTLIGLLGKDPLPESDNDDQPNRFDPSGDSQDVSKQAADLLADNNLPITDTLIAATFLGDELTRARATYILSERGESAVVQPIIERLHDPSPLVRRSAALALGRMRNIREETPHQVEAVAVVEHGNLETDEESDEDSMSKEPSADEPEEKGGTDRALYMQTTGSRRQPLFRARVLRQAVPALAATLNDPDESVRLQAAWALGELGLEEAVPHLAALFDKPEWEFTEVPEESLAKLKYPKTRQFLVALLKDPSPRRRERAARSLREMADPSVLKPLLAALGDPQACVRAEVAEALGKIGEPAAPDLAALLRQGDPVLREAAVQALGHMTMYSSVPVAVADALKDPSEEVRCLVARAIGLARCDKAAEVLAAHLNDPSLAVRRAVVHALADDGRDEAAAPLASMLKDLDAETRDTAAEGLLHCHSVAAADLLAGLLDDADPGVRLAAVKALGIQRNPAKASQLVPFLTDRDAATRAAAAWSIGNLRFADAAPDIAALLKDPDRTVCRAAIAALHKLADPAGAKGLGELAGTKSVDLDLRLDALRALGAVGGPQAAAALVAALADETPLVRQVAADQLGGVRGAGSVEALMQAVGNPDTRALARESLQQLVWRDFGTDPAAWRRWWQSRGAAAFAAFLKEPDPTAPPTPPPNTGGNQNIIFGSSDSPGLLRRILGNREDSDEGNGPPSMPMPVE